jgi:PII-like signaling protein
MATTPIGPTASHPAQRLSILLTVRDHDGRGTLMVALMQRARHAGLAGGTVFEAVEGYGTSGQLHRQHLFGLDAPVAVVFVDRPERIASFLDDVEDLLGGTVLTISDVEVIDG